MSRTYRHAPLTFPIHHRHALTVRGGGIVKTFPDSLTHDLIYRCHCSYCLAQIELKHRGWRTRKEIKHEMSGYDN